MCVVQPLQCRATHPSGWVVVVVASLQRQVTRQFGPIMCDVQPLQCRATHPSGWVLVVVVPLQMQGNPSGPIGPPMWVGHLCHSEHRECLLRYYQPYLLPSLVSEG